MKHNHDVVLLSLPPDATMRKFLADRSVPLPAGLDWSDADTAPAAVVTAVNSWTDTAARDALLADLSRVAALSHPAGREAAYEAATLTNVAVMVQLTSKYSDLHRAFWLYVHHRGLFDQAMDLLYFDGYEPRAYRHDLGIKVMPDLGPAALDAFRVAVGDYYREKQGNGEFGVAYGMVRSSGNVLVTLHLKDLPMLRVEFVGPTLKQRVGNPEFVPAIEYCPRTGVTQSIVTGGVQYQKAFLTAFAKHILHCDHIDPQRLRPPHLDLSSLRLGFNVPEVYADGFVSARVKSITLQDVQGKMKIAASAMGRSDDESITDLLRGNPATSGLLGSDWTVTAAQVDLYYPPEPSKIRRKAVKIEVTHRGRLNLHKYDESLKQQLESYLVLAGILDEGQTLTANVVRDGQDDPIGADEDLT
ncbi:hypothetical protein ACMHYJ_06140 [Castellaniella hirudinis]|uniref:hypothetical protein n=1 Tax=Castellaniella hirudinis TaxID=1144617 RepID=UPI0039C3CCBF